MNRRFLRSTTALLVGASLALTPPLTAWAQAITVTAEQAAELDALISELTAAFASGNTEAADAVRARIDAIAGAGTTDRLIAGEAIQTAPAEPAPEQAVEEAPAEQPAAETAEEQPATETAEEQPAAETAEEQPAAETAEEQPAAETAEEQPAAEGAAEQPATEPTADQQASETAGDQATASGSSEIVTAAPQDTADTITAEDTAAATSAAATAAPEAAEATAAEVVTETVTEETARSSSEEFATSARGDDSDGDRRNDFIRNALLLGAGALVLNEILRPGEQVVSDSGDRLVVEREGQLRVLRNDDVLLRRPGSDVTTYRYDDGSSRTVVARADGSEVETVRAADGRVLRRVRFMPNGETVILFDDTQAVEEVRVTELPTVVARPLVTDGTVAATDLARALAAAQPGIDRRFSLNQIRNIPAVRKLVPQISLNSINFETGSAVIRPEEAAKLADLGNSIRQMIDDAPGEVFLIEGHTDAVGTAALNLALSDRRAESLALALTEYFGVPPENLVIQGYGEADLLIRTDAAERANRRAAIRRITPLLQGS